MTDSGAPFVYPSHRHGVPLKRFTYRAYPTGGQRKDAARLFGCVRVVWNDALHLANTTYQQTGVVMSSNDISRALTVSKTTPEREWLRNVSSVPLQQVLADLHKAFGAFFRSLNGTRRGPKMKRPAFKKKTTKQSARFTRNAGFKVHQTTHGVGFVTLPKIGRIRFNLSRPLPSEPSSVTLIQQPDGRYYVSFVVDVPDAAQPTPDDNERTAAGIDVGLTDLATIVRSDGTREKIGNPRWLRSRERKLVRAQRALSRKKEGSANYEKSRITVAIHHRKVRETRHDYLRKFALDVARKNHTVGFETLNLRGLGRTRLAKSMADASLGTLMRYTQEAVAKHDGTVIHIGQFEPTTQTCSVCGTPGGKKPLHVRVWTCAGCNTELDRDYNAAVNVMVAAGLAETLNACGDSVRRTLACAESMKQEPTEQTVPDGTAA